MAGHRNKKGKKGNKPPKAPSGRCRPEQQQWYQEDFQVAPTSFSLADGGRWMAKHRSAAFNKNRKLRDHKIQFVSAGYLEGTIPVSSIPISIPISIPREEREEVAPQLDPRSNSDSLAITNTPLALFSTSDSTPPPPQPASTQPIADLDLSSAASVPSAAMARMDIQSPGTTSTASNESANDSSSEDEIIFRGRGPPAQAKPAPAPVQPDSAQSISIQASIHATGSSSSKRIRISQDSSTASAPEADSDGDAVIQELAHEVFESRLDTPKWEDAAARDYLQNVGNSEDEGNSNFIPSFARRPMDIGDFDSDNFVPKPAASRHRSDDPDSDPLQYMSTSSDAGDDIDRILATRMRLSGVQYLAVYASNSSAATHWLPLSAFKTRQELELIDEFEANQREVEQSQEYTDEDDETSDDEEENQENSDVAALLESDEAFAIRLQKQFDYDAEADTEDLFLPRPSFSNRNKASPKSHGRGPTFPSAAALADAVEQDPYGGFDIMDTERPSLRPKNKGRQSKMPPELSDSDLNAQMQATWEKDRATKRLKKAEREVLRKQGLLGRKGKGPDLRVKHKDGVDMLEVFEEIREFMFSDMHTLSLAPMDARYRSAIHQFVQQLGLSSKSRGDGADRFIVLSRTARTLTLDDDEFDEIMNQSKFRSRMQPEFRRGQRTPKAPKAFKPRPIVSYQDGEVVGASAPELGPENKGRLLLEKMGWSKGTALGAVGNKGILQPIAHTVKISKAGLQ